MKMSRADLKDLVKECLVEILAEGVGKTLTEAVVPQRRQRKNALRYRSMTNPTVSKKTADNNIPTAALQAAVEESAGGNPIMADILADTAMTTLPQMLSNSSTPSPVPGSAESIVAETKPEEMFGENVDRWANLAFNSQGRSSGMFTPPPPDNMRKLSAAELDAPVNRTKKTA